MPTLDKHHPVARWFFVAAENIPSSHPPAMILCIQMTLALLQELLLAVRDNDEKDFKESI